MTRKQFEILVFLRRWFAEHEYGPTYREIAAATGVIRSLVHGRVAALENEGYVVRSANRARGILLTSRGRGPGAGASLERAALRLLDSVRHEDPERDHAVVSAAALGDLDIALAEAGPS